MYRICWSISRTFRLNPRQYFVECDLYNDRMLYALYTVCYACTYVLVSFIMQLILGCDLYSSKYSSFVASFFAL